jgi:hypothetical protein
MFPYSTAPYRSVKEIQDFLIKNPYSSESQIQQQVFGYYRNLSWQSNKKYADMLRRGLNKGLYVRIEWRKKTGDTRSRFWYYVPEKVQNNL